MAEPNIDVQINTLLAVINSNEASYSTKKSKLTQLDKLFSGKAWETLTYTQLSHIYQHILLLPVELRILAENALSNFADVLTGAAQNSPMHALEMVLYLQTIQSKSFNSKYTDAFDVLLGRKNQELIADWKNNLNIFKNDQKTKNERLNTIKSEQKDKRDQLNQPGADAANLHAELDKLNTEREKLEKDKDELSDLILQAELAIQKFEQVFEKELVQLNQNIRAALDKLDQELETLLSTDISTLDPAQRDIKLKQKREIIKVFTRSIAEDSTGEFTKLYLTKFINQIKPEILENDPVLAREILLTTIHQALAINQPERITNWLKSILVQATNPETKFQEICTALLDEKTKDPQVVKQQYQLCFSISEMALKPEFKNIYATLKASYEDFVANNPKVKVAECFFQLKNVLTTFRNQINTQQDIAQVTSDLNDKLNKTLNILQAIKNKTIDGDNESIYELVDYLLHINDELPFPFEQADSTAQKYLVNLYQEILSYATLEQLQHLPLFLVRSRALNPHSIREGSLPPVLKNIDFKGYDNRIVNELLDSSKIDNSLLKDNCLETATCGVDLFFDIRSKLSQTYTHGVMKTHLAQNVAEKLPRTTEVKKYREALPPYALSMPINLKKIKEDLEAKSDVTATKHLSGKDQKSVAMQTMRDFDDSEINCGSYFYTMRTTIHGYDITNPKTGLLTNIALNDATPIGEEQVAQALIVSFGTLVDSEGRPQEYLTKLPELIVKYYEKNNINIPVTGEAFLFFRYLREQTKTVRGMWQQESNGATFLTFAKFSGLRLTEQDGQKPAPLALFQLKSRIYANLDLSSKDVEVYPQENYFEVLNPQELLYELSPAGRLLDAGIADNADYAQQLLAPLFQEQIKDPTFDEALRKQAQFYRENPYMALPNIQHHIAGMLLRAVTYSKTPVVGQPDKFTYEFKLNFYDASSHALKELLNNLIRYPIGEEAQEKLFQGLEKLNKYYKEANTESLISARKQEEELGLFISRELVTPELITQLLQERVQLKVTELEHIHSATERFKEWFNKHPQPNEQLRIMMHLFPENSDMPQDLVLALKIYRQEYLARVNARHDYFSEKGIDDYRKKERNFTYKPYDLTKDVVSDKLLREALLAHIKTIPDIHQAYAFAKMAEQMTKEGIIPELAVLQKYEEKLLELLKTRISLAESIYPAAELEKNLLGPTSDSGLIDGLNTLRTEGKLTSQFFELLLANKAPLIQGIEAEVDEVLSPDLLATHKLFNFNAARTLPQDTQTKLPDFVKNRLTKISNLFDKKLARQAVQNQLFDEIINFIYVATRTKTTDEGKKAYTLALDFIELLRNEFPTDYQTVVDHLMALAGDENSEQYKEFFDLTKAKQDINIDTVEKTLKYGTVLAHLAKTPAHSKRATEYVAHELYYAEKYHAVMFNAKSSEEHLLNHHGLMLTAMKFYSQGPSSFIPDITRNIMHGHHPLRKGMFRSAPKLKSNITKNDFDNDLFEVLLARPDLLSSVRHGYINKENPYRKFFEKLSITQKIEYLTRLLTENPQAFDQLITAANVHDRDKVRDKIFPLIKTGFKEELPALATDNYSEYAIAIKKFAELLLAICHHHTGKFIDDNDFVELISNAMKDMVNTQGQYAAAIILCYALVEYTDHAMIEKLTQKHSPFAEAIKAGLTALSEKSTFDNYLADDTRSLSMDYYLAELLKQTNSDKIDKLIAVVEKFPALITVADKLTDDDSKKNLALLKLSIIETKINTNAYQRTDFENHFNKFFTLLKSNQLIDFANADPAFQEKLFACVSHTLEQANQDNVEFVIKQPNFMECVDYWFDHCVLISDEAKQLESLKILSVNAINSLITHKYKNNADAFRTELNLTPAQNLQWLSALITNGKLAEAQLLLDSKVIQLAQADNNETLAAHLQLLAKLMESALKQDATNGNKTPAILLESLLSNKQFLESPVSGLQLDNPDLITSIKNLFAQLANPLLVQQQELFKLIRFIILNQKECFTTWKQHATYDTQFAVINALLKGGVYGRKLIVDHKLLENLQQFISDEKAKSTDPGHAKAIDSQINPLILQLLLTALETIEATALLYSPRFRNIMEDFLNNADVKLLIRLKQECDQDASKQTHFDKLCEVLKLTDVVAAKLKPFEEISNAELPSAEELALQYPQWFLYELNLVVGKLIKNNNDIEALGANSKLEKHLKDYVALSDNAKVVSPKLAHLLISQWQAGLLFIDEKFNDRLQLQNMERIGNLTKYQAWRAQFKPILDAVTKSEIKDFYFKQDIKTKKIELLAGAKVDDANYRMLDIAQIYKDFDKEIMGVYQKSEFEDREAEQALKSKANKIFEKEFSTNFYEAITNAFLTTQFSAEDVKRYSTLIHFMHVAGLDEYQIPAPDASLLERMQALLYLTYAQPLQPPIDEKQLTSLIAEHTFLMMDLQDKRKKLTELLKKGRKSRLTKQELDDIKNLRLEIKQCVLLSSNPNFVYLNAIQNSDFSLFNSSSLNKPAASQKFSRLEQLTIAQRADLLARYFKELLQGDPQANRESLAQLKNYLSNILVSDHQSEIGLAYLHQILLHLDEKQLQTLFTSEPDFNWPVIFGVFDEKLANYSQTIDSDLNSVLSTVGAPQLRFIQFYLPNSIQTWKKSTNNLLQKAQVAQELVQQGRGVVAGFLLGDLQVFDKQLEQHASKQVLDPAFNAALSASDASALRDIAQKFQIYSEQQFKLLAQLIEQALNDSSKDRTITIKVQQAYTWLEHLLVKYAQISDISEKQHWQNSLADTLHCVGAKFSNDEKFALFSEIYRRLRAYSSEHQIDIPVFAGVANSLRELCNIDMVGVFSNILQLPEVKLSEKDKYLFIKQYLTKSADHKDLAHSNADPSVRNLILQYFQHRVHNLSGVIDPESAINFLLFMRNMTNNQGPLVFEDNDDHGFKGFYAELDNFYCDLIQNPAKYPNGDQLRAQLLTNWLAAAGGETYRFIDIEYHLHNFAQLPAVREFWREAINQNYTNAGISFTLPENLQPDPNILNSYLILDDDTSATYSLEPFGTYRDELIELEQKIYETVDACSKYDESKVRQFFKDCERSYNIQGLKTAAISQKPDGTNQAINYLLSSMSKTPPQIKQQNINLANQSVLDGSTSGLFEERNYSRIYSDSFAEHGISYNINSDISAEFIPPKGFQDNLPSNYLSEDDHESKYISFKAIRFLSFFDRTTHLKPKYNEHPFFTFIVEKNQRHTDVNDKPDIHQKVFIRDHEAFYEFYKNSQIPTIKNILKDSSFQDKLFALRCNRLCDFLLNCFGNNAYLELAKDDLLQFIANGDVVNTIKAFCEKNSLDSSELYILLDNNNFQPDNINVLINFLTEHYKKTDFPEDVKYYLLSKVALKNVVAIADSKTNLKTYFVNSRENYLMNQSNEFIKYLYDTIENGNEKLALEDLFRDFPDAKKDSNSRTPELINALQNAFQQINEGVNTSSIKLFKPEILFLDHYYLRLPLNFRENFSKKFTLNTTELNAELDKSHPENLIAYLVRLLALPKEAGDDATLTNSRKNWPPALNAFIEKYTEIYNNEIVPQALATLRLPEIGKLTKPALEELKIFIGEAASVAVKDKNNADSAKGKFTFAQLTQMVDRVERQFAYDPDSIKAIRNIIQNTQAPPYVLLPPLELKQQLLEILGVTDQKPVDAELINSLLQLPLELRDFIDAYEQVYANEVTLFKKAQGRYPEIGEVPKLDAAFIQLHKFILKHAPQATNGDLPQSEQAIYTVTQLQSLVNFLKHDFNVIFLTQGKHDLYTNRLIGLEAKITDLMANIKKGKYQPAEDKNNDVIYQFEIIIDEVYSELNKSDAKLKTAGIAAEKTKSYPHDLAWLYSAAYLAQAITAFDTHHKKPSRYQFLKKTDFENALSQYGDIHKRYSIVLNKLKAALKNYLNDDTLSYLLTGSPASQVQNYSVYQADPQVLSHLLNNCLIADLTNGIFNNDYDKIAQWLELLNAALKNGVPEQQFYTYRDNGYARYASARKAELYVKQQLETLMENNQLLNNAEGPRLNSIYRLVYAMAQVNEDFAFELFATNLAKAKLYLSPVLLIKLLNEYRPHLEKYVQDNEAGVNLTSSKKRDAQSALNYLAKQEAKIGQAAQLSSKPDEKISVETQQLRQENFATLYLHAVKQLVADIEKKIPEINGAADEKTLWSTVSDSVELLSSFLQGRGFIINQQIGTGTVLENELDLNLATLQSLLTQLDETILTELNKTLFDDLKQKPLVTEYASKIKAALQSISPRRMVDLQTLMPNTLTHLDAIFARVDVLSNRASHKIPYEQSYHTFPGEYVLKIPDDSAVETSESNTASYLANRDINIDPTIDVRYAVDGNIYSQYTEAGDQIPPQRLFLKFISNNNDNLPHTVSSLATLPINVARETGTLFANIAQHQQELLVMAKQGTATDHRRAVANLLFSKTPSVLLERHDDGTVSYQIRLTVEQVIFADGSKLVNTPQSIFTYVINGKIESSLADSNGNTVTHQKTRAFDIINHQAFVLLTERAPILKNQLNKSDKKSQFVEVLQSEYKQEAQSHFEENIKNNVLFNPSAKWQKPPEIPEERVDKSKLHKLQLRIHESRQRVKKIEGDINSLNFSVKI
ncbi:MAG: hypothetical protein Tsb005_04620 [Gammaproteobacteria bacterium]